MAFLIGELKVQAYNDTSDTNSPLVNIPNIDRKWKNSALTQDQVALYNIPANGTITVNVNGISPTRLYLYADLANIQVNINALGNILFALGEPAYMPATVTSLVITNTSATLAVNVEVGLFKI